ncbi:glycosyltransferase family 2 protein [Deinococcus oregonensis]|uniref:Glycosyltransferase family 2 protein n=1 Tax=Deinococcus oregonensis TaxID=1805970 RepID=A0ABV6AUZ3_9DEIO
MTSQKLPMVSVIVPAYNAASYLPDALNSILGQTYPHLEVVVVNDGSTDDSAAVLAQFQAQDSRVKVVHQSNLGLPSARNTGIAASAGELLAYLDADDTIHPEKIERQLAYLQQHPEIDLVYSDYCRADQDLNLVSEEVIGIKRLPLDEAYVYTNVFPVMSPLLRRRLADRVGDFDPSLRAAEDWDYWLRCQRAGQFGYLPGFLSVYRIHGTQMHKDYEFMLKYCRMAAAKNFSKNSRSYRRMIGSVLWWQFGMKMRQTESSRLQALCSPDLLGTALRMLWEVKSVKDVLFIRHAFRHGL